MRMLRFVSSIALISVGVGVNGVSASPTLTVASLQERIVAARHVEHVSTLTPNPRRLTKDNAWKYSGLKYAVAEKCFRMSDTSTVTHPQPCLGGDLRSSTTIVIFGDSAVGNWTPALRAAGELHHWRVASLQYEGCMLAFLTTESSTCQAFHRRLPATIAALHPTLVIGVGGYAASGSAFDATFARGVRDAVNALRQQSPSARYVLWGTSPQLPLSAPVCVTARRTSINTCGVDFRRGDTSPQSFGATVSRDRRAAALAKVRFVAVDAFFCAAAWCPAVVDHTLVYVDERHVSERYSLSLEPLVSSTVSSVLNSTDSGH